MIRTSSISVAVIAGLLLTMIGTTAEAGDPPLKDEEKWVDATEAPPEQLKELLAAYEDALDKKASEPIAAALLAILPFNNPALLDVAEDALKYKAGSEDRKAVQLIARQRGIRKPARIQEMIAEREEAVQVIGARMLGGFPSDGTVKLLRRTFGDKRVLSDKPKLAKEALVSLARLRDERIWSDVESEFKKFRDKDIMRACVLYFGLMKEKRVAKMLCDHIDEPQPGNVNSGTNPPSSYWETRWKAWDNMKDMVQWALKEITGYDGNFHSSKQARDYINDHARELGIR